MTKVPKAVSYPLSSKNLALKMLLMTIVLPHKKQQILSFLNKYIQEHGYAPTLTEIAKKFRLNSLATVHEHLELLEKLGFIRRNKGELIIVEPEVQSIWKEAAGISLPLVGLITAGKPIECLWVCFLSH